MEELGITSWTDYLETPQAVLINRLVFRRERNRLAAMERDQQMAMAAAARGRR